ncbi:MAG: diguanylate cyclase [Pseudomonadota bacterium]
MAGRVLIVDPMLTTRIVLKVKLASAYFTVDQAGSVAEALEEINQAAPDVVLCEYEMEGGGASALRARLRGRGIPIIALLPEEPGNRRAEALEAGLQDVISRPYDDRTLLARIRNLLRARTTRDELRLRADTSAALGFAEKAPSFVPLARVGLVAETPAESLAWKAALAETLHHDTEVTSPGEIVGEGAEGKRYDALVVAISGRDAQQRLDFVSSLRARPETRHTAVLAVSPAETADLAITALDTGAGDLMASGFEHAEAAQRLCRLLRQRCEERSLRRSLKAGLEAAVTDPLTGLFNRRYAMPYLDRMAHQAKQARRCFALMVLDLDHFKRVNDLHGHGVGDAVLVEFARRLQNNLRSVDLVARMGGEEFIVAMPDTPLGHASRAAKRLCELTRARPFACDLVDGGIKLSVSVGLSLGGHGRAPTGAPLTTSVPQLIDQADHALFDAKERGRDRVRIGRSAA